MAEIKKINWTKKALKDYLTALDYWSDRNKNTIYAEKIILLVQDKIRLIKDFPKIGRKTTKENYRYILIRNYLLIYKLQQDTITIMRFWQANQKQQKIIYFK